MLSLSFAHSEIIPSRKKKEEKERESERMNEGGWRSVYLSTHVSYIILST
jgi:hypothetical protein